MFLKLQYDRKAGRMDIYRRGSDTPIAILSPDEFADLMSQIGDFVDRFTPPKQPRPLARALHNSFRKESWKWIGGVILEKVSGIFKK